MWGEENEIYITLAKTYTIKKIFFWPPAIIGNYAPSQM
jgi:hypothetical protein